MKDIYKNPIFYYVAVPLLAALWPLSVWLHYLPKAQSDLEKDCTAYEEGRQVMQKILTLDPMRLQFSQANITEDKFDYAIAVEKAATKCAILQTKYSVSIKPPRVSNKEKSQNATVSLKNVDMVSFARFLSSLQMTWANLQCDEINLTRMKSAAPDQWDVDVRLKYYY